MKGKNVKDAVEKENETGNPTQKTIKKTLFVIAAVLVVTAGFFVHRETSKYQSTDDAYVESHMVQIAPRVSGQILEVFINDNQKINEGDVVAKIDDADYKVRYEQANAQYQKALLSQNVAKANLVAVNSEINNAQKDLDRYKNLYEAGAVSKQVLDGAQTKYDGVKARQSNAEQAILSGTKSKVADADLKALKALRDQAELAVGYTTVKAPRSGTVTNKKVEKGAFVQTGQPLFAIVPDEVWIVANFKENQVGQMKLGQSVDIKVDTYPGKVFKGKIDSIQRASGAKSSLFPPENAVGSFVKIVQRIPVKILFDEPPNPDEYTIVTGMSVVPKVRVK